MKEKRKAKISKDEIPAKKTKQVVLKSKLNKENNDTPKLSAKKFSKKDKPPRKNHNQRADPPNKNQQKFKNFQNKQNDKLKNGIHNKSDTPLDWNEFKKKKKEVRLKRKQNKSMFEVVTRAKQIGETLRKKILDGGTEERNKLVNELHTLLGNQGNYVKFVLQHDMARIVQYMLKFGNQTIREEIAFEIIPSTVHMLQSKYGRYCIKRLFKYGNAKTRSAGIKAMYGSAVKLTSHAVSTHIFEYIYSTWAQPLEKIHLIQEFFGDLYKQTKDDEIKHLRDVYKHSPGMKMAALGAVKANLSRILNKDLLDSGLIQSVLYQYLMECSESERNDLIGQLAPHAVVLSNSKDGSRAVMECIWCGTNKDRKAILKAIKEHALELCKHEHGHAVLIAILDGVDDTVLINKLIISQIVGHSLDVAKDEWGRKVILWLVAPAQSTHFHPTFISELERGREKSSVKKSPEVRRKEILDYSSDILLVSMQMNTKEWFQNASVSVVALAILKTRNGKTLSEVLTEIAKLVTDKEWKIHENEDDILGIEHTGLHMTLKKLIQNDKEAMNDDKPVFSEILLQHLADDTIKSWLKMNRGCFLLVAMLENGGENVANGLKAKLNKYTKLLKKKNTPGSKILLKKVT